MSLSPSTKKHKGRDAIARPLCFFAICRVSKPVRPLPAMKKLLVFLLFAGLFASDAAAQSPAPMVNKKKHKIVFQLTNGDTLLHKAVLKQITNALNAAPNSKIEVVCHNNGITLLQKDKTTQAPKIKELSAKGVVFVACENTLAERKIPKTDIVPEAGFVPAGIIEVVDKQEKGWAYIKATF